MGTWGSNLLRCTGGYIRAWGRARPMPSGPFELLIGRPATRDSARIPPGGLGPA